ncbi:monosaccharide ABC transporter membrane protein, CUT2 family [Pelosinus fermentans]|uniref:ABC-type transporter, integral membrane subunit n=1 Tax=Pelosinus fermentans B4 TaxID=1149862 RepID=I8RMN1_9FIRM|nr:MULTISPECIES: ABC transporter permease [Pelosinus]EIW20145.1 ABC-type transporter, integral membrane subunit [Pelosinus fermentans B4]OAM93049.1 ABC-type transporter, integral membrane subunit [Pelosinus fermentans DSM 17108]SDQ65273.1 monosaccharide ABC transporter membrane protein, CUT2 family [Pelosinus fermentans]
MIGVKRSHEWILLLFFIGLIIIMSLLAPSFLTVNNLLSVTQQMSEFGILALGVTVVIITSGIDLSVGSIAGLTTIVIAMTYGWSGSLVAAILLGILTGALCGAFNGVLIAKIGVPPILVTLGTMTFFNGIALVLSKGNAISDLPEEFYFVGQGYLFGNIPVQTVIFLVLAILTSLLLSRTPWGRRVYAVGNNSVAAVFSGVRVDKVLLYVYIFAGIMAAVSGWIISSRVSTARADLGAVYVMQSIAATVLGGTNIAGGSGTIFGTVIGVSVFAVLANGLNLIGVSPFAQNLLMGLALILVLLINNMSIIKRKFTIFIR